MHSSTNNFVLHGEWKHNDNKRVQLSNICSANIWIPPPLVLCKWMYMCHVISTKHSLNGNKWTTRFRKKLLFRRRKSNNIFNWKKNCFKELSSRLHRLNDLTLGLREVWNGKTTQLLSFLFITVKVYLSFGTTNYLMDMIIKCIWLFQVFISALYRIYILTKLMYRTHTCILIYITLIVKLALLPTFVSLNNQY